eukprot:6207741-Pleurochrysis_carterae.AAC.1
MLADFFFRRKNIWSIPFTNKQSVSVHGTVLRLQRANVNMRFVRKRLPRATAAQQRLHAL